MKKRLLSFMLVVAMLCSCIVPAAADADTGEYDLVPAATTAYGEDIKVALVGSEVSLTTAEFGDNTPMLQFDWKIQATRFNGTQWIVVTYDTTKLSLRERTSGYKPATVGATSAEPGNIVKVTTEASDVGISQSERRAIKPAGSDFATAYLSVGSGSTHVTAFAGALTTVGSFWFALINGNTIDNLDNTSVRWTTVEGTNLVGAASAAEVCSSNTTYGSANVHYNASSSAAVYHFQSAPVLSYPNSDVLNLASVELEMDYTAVNSPVLLPAANAEGPRTVNVKSLKAFDALGTEFPAAEAAKVSYTFALKKAGTPNTALDPVTEAPYFTINPGSGAVTILPGAPELNLAVEAHGEYTNKKNVQSTGDDSATLAVKHGNVGTTPGGDNSDDDTKAFSGVIVKKAGAVVVTSATGSTYTEEIGIPKTGDPAAEVTFVGVAVDQFGGEWTAVTPSWAANSLGDNTGKVSVPAGTTPIPTEFDYVCTATDGTSTYTAKVHVIADNTAVTWPTLSNSAITYGQPISDLKWNNDGYVTVDGVRLADADVTWAWNVTDVTETLAVSQKTIEMKAVFNGNDANPKKHTYNITVMKATPIIEIDGDPLSAISIEEGGYNVNVLGTKIKNPCTNKVDTDITPTFTLTQPAGKDIFVLDNTLSGGKDASVKTKDASVTFDLYKDDEGTLKIAVAGAANYKDTDREIKLLVENQLLRADIVFTYGAAGAPKFGEVITATITPKSYQPNSLTADVEYTWGHVDAEGNFTATANGTDHAGHLQTLGATDPQTLMYTPNDNDLGETLALKLQTPSSKPGYNYIHSVTEATSGPVTGSVQPKPTAIKYTATKDSITLTEVTLDGVVNPIDVSGYHDALKAAGVDTDGTNLRFAIRAKGDTNTPDPVKAADWQRSNLFSAETSHNIAVNTEYDIYVVNFKGSGFASSVFHTEVVTSGKIIVQDEPGANPPIVIDPGFTEETKPSLELTGTAKFGETLTAVAKDAKVQKKEDSSYLTKLYTYIRWETEDGDLLQENHLPDGATYDSDNAWTVTYEISKDPVTGQSKGAVGDKKIVCILSTEPKSDYGGSVKKETAAVEKNANTNTIDKTGLTGVAPTSVGGTDGKIEIDTAKVSITAPKKYQVVKIADGKQLSDYNDETQKSLWDGVAEATIDTTGATPFIGGLADGTYAFREAPTVDTKPSAAVDVVVPAFGFDITGRITSFNAALGMTCKLIAADTSETTAVITLETLATTAGQQTQSFTISAVTPGTYTLVISKRAHLDLYIENVVVSNAAVSLASLGDMYMACGDIDGDGWINAADGNLVTAEENFTKAPTDTGVTYPSADLDGDGTINASDGNYIVDQAVFSKHYTEFKLTFNPGT